MGKSRADILMVTENELYGIEIKSDADTYTRLDSQIKDYDAYFEYNIIAVGTSHAAHVADHIPEHWGIITVEEVDGRTDCYYFRKAQRNPRAKARPLSRVRKQITFLWRPEIAHIQAINGLPRYPGKSKAFVQKVCLERIPVETLKKQISDELFERDYSKLPERKSAARVRHYRMRK